MIRATEVTNRAKAAARRLAWMLALAGALVGSTATPAHATHFRYATINWRTPDPAVPNQISFRVEVALRWTFFNPRPAIGDTVDLLLAGDRFSFGDGASMPMQGVVTSIDTLQDVLVAEFTAIHTYPTSLTSTVAFFESCCRVSTLREGNDDRPYRVETMVVIDAADPNSSPVAASLPIFTLPVGHASSFLIPAADPDGDPLTFEFPPPISSRLITNPPSGLTMTPAGLVSWTPTVTGLYAMQVRVRDDRGAFATLDVILNVVVATGTPPSIAIAGATSPPPIVVTPGTPVSFDVVGSDPDLDPVGALRPVTLSSGSLPLGSTMTPSLPFTQTSPATSQFDWTPALADAGTRVLVFAATDDTGLQTSGQIAVEVVPNQPPVLTCPADFPVEATGPDGASVDVAVDLFDPDDDAMSLEWSVDGTLADTGAVPAGAGPTTVTLTRTLGLGAHDVSLAADDGTNPPVSCTTVVTVQDTTPPVIDFPASVVEEATGPGGAVVSFDVTASDAVDPDPDVSCSPESGTPFPLGSTPVSCTATDASGNASSAGFDVQVVDTTPPALLDVPPNMTLEATGPSGAVVAWAGPTASDAVDPAPLVFCAPASGSTFPLGLTVVTCTATDDAGNTAMASFGVQVVDTTPPDLVVPDDVTVEASGSGGATASWPPPTATDLVDPDPTIACDRVSGSLFPFGETLVTCTATDDFGNRATGSFRVIVRDTSAPVIESVTPDNGYLWPPNHMFVLVTLSVDVTDIDPDTTCRIVAVESDEPANGLGDGDQAPDFTGISGLSVELRAERSGRGDGRTYTLHVECADTSGNVATASTTVQVLKSQGQR